MRIFCRDTAKKSRWITSPDVIRKLCALVLPSPYPSWSGVTVRAKSNVPFLHYFLRLLSWFYSYWVEVKWCGDSIKRVILLLLLLLSPSTSSSFSAPLMMMMGMIQASSITNNFSPNSTGVFTGSSTIKRSMSREQKKTMEGATSWENNKRRSRRRRKKLHHSIISLDDHFPRHVMWMFRWFFFLPLVALLFCSLFTIFFSYFPILAWQSVYKCSICTLPLRFSHFPFSLWLERKSKEWLVAKAHSTVRRQHCCSQRE